MISGISSSNTMQYQMQSAQAAQTLSEDKKKELQEILGKYDSKTATGDTMKSMMDEIKKAGFTPKDGSIDVIKEAGFEMPEPPEGGPEKMGPPPSGGQNSPMPDYLMDFVKKQGSGEVTQEDITSLIKSLEKDGKYTTGALVDQKS